jgi:hypothetical protein
MLMDLKRGSRGWSGRLGKMIAGERERGWWKHEMAREHC